MTGGIVAIIGVGAGATAIDANQIDRVLHIHEGALVEVNGVSVINGLSTTGGPMVGPGSADGGAIYNAGLLTLRRCAVSSSAARDGSNYGGGGPGWDGGAGKVSEPLPYDLDSTRRFTDVGAVADTGNGTPPIVDMGAYEYIWYVYLPLVARQ